MKQLKNKSLWASFIIAFLVALGAAAYFLVNKPAIKELSRGKFAITLGSKARKKVYPDFSIIQKMEKLIIKAPREDRVFTLMGTFLNNEKSSEKRSVKLIEGLRGKYIVDFFCCYPSWLNREANAFLEIHPASGAKPSPPKVSIKLEKGTLLGRYQFPIEIGKDDTLVFSLKGKGIIAVSEPVFYKSRDYKKKELVFIISADTLRRDHVGVYNKEKKTTPELDRFAKDAVVFKNAYSSSSWTLAAHASLFTGTYSHQHNLNFQKENKSKLLKRTLIKHLQKKFITVSFNGGVFISYLFGFSQGFDMYHQSKDDTQDAFSAKKMFERAISNIQNDKYNAPLLFFLHTYQIHSLFHPEKELAEKYLKNTPHKYDSFEIIELTEHGKNQYKTNVSPEERGEIIKVYDAGIYTFDYRFGEFIRYLKEKNLYDDSLIVILSDHGEAFQDHGGWEHGHTLYNELVKIPLLVKFPGNRWAGNEEDSVVSIADVLPTVLELNRIDFKKAKKNTIPGESLIKTINSMDSNREVISYLAPYACSRTPMKIAIISKKYKCIYNKAYTDTDLGYFLTPPPVLEAFEFYNQLDDEYETKDIKNTHRAEFSKMVKFLRSIKYSTDEVAFPKEMQNKLKQLGYIN